MLQSFQEEVQEQEAVTLEDSVRHILLIEADLESTRSLCSVLTEGGFQVTALGSGEDVLRAIDRHRPHLILVDWEHPGIIATELVYHIRRDAPMQRPRLVALSGYASEQQIVTGFELGIDDYVVRPYSAPVLLARLRAILRLTQRHRGPAPDVLEFHRLRMDLTDLRLMVDDRIVALRPMEIRILQFLMRYPERVFTREQLISRIWGRNSPAEQRTIDVNIQRTRRALASHGCGDYLQTVRAFGYRLSAQRT